MFITFEGPDGSGKTTALNTLKKYLEDQGIDFIFTREPGSEAFKETAKLRQIILDPENEISPMAEAILYAADRRLHLDKLIFPALKANKIVLCDRYFDSSIAYQGGGRQLGIEKIKKLNELITDHTYPDLTIFFDLTPEESAKRVDNRAPKDRLELEGSEFHIRVYNAYKELIDMFPNRFYVVDAKQSREVVFEQVKNKVVEFINKK